MHADFFPLEMKASSSMTMPRVSPLEMYVNRWETMWKILLAIRIRRIKHHRAVLNSGIPLREGFLQLREVTLWSSGGLHF